jgi:hypothetical protein
MVWQNERLNELAARAAEGEPEALAAWCQEMEADLTPIVRRALRTQGRYDHPERAGLTQHILSAARELAASDPLLAARGREGLVRPLARQLAAALVQRRQPEASVCLGILETIPM